MHSINHADRTAPLRRTPLAALVMLTIGMGAPAAVLAEEGTAERASEAVQAPPPPGPFQSFGQDHRFEQRGSMGSRGQYGHFPPPGYDPEQRAQGRPAMPMHPPMVPHQGGQPFPPHGYGHPAPPAGGMPVPPSHAPAHGYRSAPPGHAPQAGRPGHAGPPQHRPMPHGQHPYGRSPEHEAWMQQRQAEREAFLREQAAEREAFQRHQEERRRAWEARQQERDARWSERGERRGMPDDYGQRPMAPQHGYGMPPYPGYPQPGWSPRGRD